MEVMMREPRNSQIHVSQAVPGASPLTWAMEGDAEINKVRLKKMCPMHQQMYLSISVVQILVSQNAADDSSPLSCSPACPQGDSGGSPSSGKGVSCVKW